MRHTCLAATDEQRRVATRNKNKNPISRKTKPLPRTTPEGRSGSGEPPMKGIFRSYAMERRGVSYSEEDWYLASGGMCQRNSCRDLNLWQGLGNGGLLPLHHGCRRLLVIRCELLDYMFGVEHRGKDGFAARRCGEVVLSTTLIYNTRGKSS